tara:strand:+ start:69066 stop:70154 length:1089 start_codon:yes stop_codon:yes gene_type:complete
MQDHVNTIVIGAGVIGLAIAKKLSEHGREVLVLEKEKNFGMGISSRNSEVIHAGLYFSPNMLKSKLCISGKDQLYQYARSRGIPHRRCGKLLVACSEAELFKLEQIKLNAEFCGVDDLESLSAADCLKLEPDLSAVAGLFSPSSGVIDSHSLMVSLLGDLENAGGQAVFKTTIKRIEKTSSGFLITLNDDYQISSNILINAAGLGAMDVAHLIDALDKSLIPELVMAKGHYLSYCGRTNFKHLVYPLPFQGGLGIHLTLDMAGGVKFGPDVVYVKDEDYNLTTLNKTTFIHSIKHYFPSVEPDKLTPDYAGIRPKLSKDGEDFLIQFPTDHGIEGLINLLGMESPGLTSCLSIADYVMENIK